MPSLSIAALERLRLELPLTRLGRPITKCWKKLVTLGKSRNQNPGTTAASTSATVRAPGVLACWRRSGRAGRAGCAGWRRAAYCTRAAVYCIPGVVAAVHAVDGGGIGTSYSEGSPNKFHRSSWAAAAAALYSVVGHGDGRGAPGLRGMAPAAWLRSILGPAGWRPIPRQITGFGVRLVLVPAVMLARQSEATNRSRLARLER